MLARVRGPLSLAFTRFISRTPPASLHIALGHAKQAIPPAESDALKPGHAVISTFDLFSIGGQHPRIIPICQLTPSSSRPKQLAHSRSHACWENFHRGPQ